MTASQETSLQATPHGFMTFNTISFEKMTGFMNILKNFRLSVDEVFALAKECVVALRALGKKMKQEQGCEIAASAIEKALKEHTDDTVDCARGICDKCIHVYTQEKDGVGFIYREVNLRLRSAPSASCTTLKALKNMVRDACGDLTSYTLLLWDGLKTMFAAAPETENSMNRIALYRGYRLPLPAYEALCAQKNKYIAFPGFTSFSLKLDVALQFPMGGKPDPAKEVDLILILDAFSRPAIEEKAFKAFKGEREVVMHPFSTFFVHTTGGTAGPTKRPVVKLCDVELVTYLFPNLIKKEPAPLEKKQVTLSVEGLYTPRKVMVTAGMLVKDLLQSQNRDLGRTDLAELWDSDGCVIPNDQLVLDFVQGGAKLTLRPHSEKPPNPPPSPSPPTPTPTPKKPSNPPTPSSSSPTPTPTPAPGPQKKTAITPVSFRPNPEGGYTVSGATVDFTQEYGYRTVFLDLEPTTGIYEWVIKISYKDVPKLRIFFMGVANTTLEKSLFTSTIGAKTGSSSFQFWRDDDGEFKSTLTGCGRKTSQGITNTEMTVPDKALVACEIDMGEGIMSFSINGKKYPHCIYNVIAPLFIGVTGLDVTFTTVSLSRLSAPSPLPGPEALSAWSMMTHKSVKDKEHEPASLDKKSLKL